VVINVQIQGREAASSLRDPWNEVKQVNKEVAVI